MPYTSVNVPLDKCELAALVRMAEVDCRHPREQMRHLLRVEASKRGLLTKEQQMNREEDLDGETAVTGQ